MDPLARAVEILNAPELAATVAGHVRRLEAVYAGAELARPVALCGEWGVATSSPYREPEACIREQIVSLAGKTELLGNEAVFRPGITGVGLHGVHFLDTLLGAGVYDLDGTGNWQVRTLDRPVGGLRPPDLATHPLWATARRAARAFVASGVSNVFFETPCLSSPFNEAINLYGQQILFAMYDDAAAVHRDLRVITDLIKSLTRWYLDTMPRQWFQAVASSARFRPPGYGHICGCSCQLLSGGQYREFVAPYDEEVLAVFPNGGMIHLCGRHTQHVPAWRAMRSLKAVQVNDAASADLPAYWAGLRPDQVFYNLECPQMPWRQARALTGNRRMVHTAPPGSHAWCREFATE